MSKKTLDDARAACDKEKAELMEWTSLKEGQAVEKYFRGKSSPPYSVWMGMRKITGRKPYGWSWESGRTVSYEAWMSSNAKDKTKSHDCANLAMGGATQVGKSVGKWNGAKCSSRQQVLCMKKGEWKF